MKNILWVLIVFAKSLIAQTYISPTIGYDFAKINSLEGVGYIDLLDKKYNIHNVTIGAKVKQKINRKFDVAAYSSFSKKYADAGVWGVVGYNGVKFHYLQNSLQFNYNYKSYFCALGGNINILSNWTETKDKKIATKPHAFKIVEKGIRVAIGRYYKKICVETYFYKGLTSSTDPFKIQLKPVNSFGILVSYDIKIFDSLKKRTNTKCPKF